MEEDNTFDPELIHSIFKLIWTRTSSKRTPLHKNQTPDANDCSEIGPGTSRRNNRPTSANLNAVKLSCELIRVFVSEAVQRAAAIAEAEGVSKIEGTHFERIIPQLLLDF